MFNCATVYFKQRERYFLSSYSYIQWLIRVWSQAQRALGASGIFPRPPQTPDFNNLNMNVPAIPVPGMNTAREAQYAKRIKELEEELRLMKVENDKNVCIASNTISTMMLIICIEVDDC